MGAETPKQFLELDGAPILVHSLRKIASCELITEIIVATRSEEVDRLAERLRAEKFRQTLRVVKGGDSRQESVAAALKHVAEGTEIVLVHDAVRPFVTREQIARVIEEARNCGAAILGIPAMDTVKEVKRASLPEDVALITMTIPRERVVLAQTPQVFYTKLLKEAFARAEADFTRSLELYPGESYTRRGLELAQQRRTPEEASPDRKGTGALSFEDFRRLVNQPAAQ